MRFFEQIDAGQKISRRSVERALGEMGTAARKKQIRKASRYASRPECINREVERLNCPIRPLLLEDFTLLSKHIQFLCSGGHRVRNSRQRCFRSLEVVNCFLGPAEAPRPARPSETRAHNLLRAAGLLRFFDHIVEECEGGIRKLSAETGICRRPQDCLPAAHISDLIEHDECFALFIPALAQLPEQPEVFGEDVANSDRVFAFAGRLVRAKCGAILDQ
ncbi:MAG TPA: hypothetical protein VKE96_33615 [Vicinamibacterales bacterium]|nr:hypothetical protein [Vicinamibacterales bacterium]